MIKPTSDLATVQTVYTGEDLDFRLAPGAAAIDAGCILPNVNDDFINAIKDRKIDAFFWVGGLPTAAVTDLAATPGTKIRMIDHADLVPAMNKKWGNLYVEDAIPKTTYSGMDADNKQATVMNVLVANENMDEKTAYNIVKTIFEKRDDLIAVHKEAANFKLENQKAAASPVPSTLMGSRYSICA